MRARHRGRATWVTGRILVVLALGCSVIGFGLPAGATFPGSNGKIVFVSDRDGNAEIYSVDPDGTGLVNLTNDADSADVTPAWSPDGTKIAFFKDDVLNVMDADGANPAAVSGSVYGFFPTWSPDGRFIAYLGDDNDIHVVDIPGAGGDTNITNSPEWERPPAWSPDGSRILFGRLDPNSASPLSDDIWIMDPDGARQHQLTKTRGFDGLPDWSPDGSKIVFCAQGLYNLDIFTMNPDGKQRVNLTSSDDRGECAPRWSPDGHSIAYHDGSDEIDVFVMNADGTGATPLAPSEANDGSPTWQPLNPPPDTTGFDVAFSRVSGGGTADIWLMTADGRQSLPITKTPKVSEIRPDWSPDGTKIAYLADAETGLDVYTMAADGSSQVALVTGSDILYWAGVTWSPDGSEIAFSALGDTGSSEVFVVASDGSSDPIQVTSAGVDSAVWDWAPDGTILITRFDGSDDEIFGVDRWDGTATQLTYNDGYDYDAHASPIPGDTRIVWDGTADCCSNADILVGGRTTLPISSTLVTSTPDDFEAWPVFSPDGQQVIFMRAVAPSPRALRGGWRWQLFRADVDGQNEVMISDMRWHDLHPSWRGAP